MRPTLTPVRIFEYGIRGSHWAAGYHTGRDYQMGDGNRLRATRSGRVVFAGLHGGWGASYGYHVIVDTNGIRHAYCHMSRISVKAGQYVSEGQHLGYSGHTGNVTGPHCHYEERHSPYTYWNHRRPVFDLTTGLPTVDVSALNYALRKRSNYGHGVLVKRELTAALKANGLRVTPMKSGSAKMGLGARSNFKKLQKKWFKHKGTGYDLGLRLVMRLGDRNRKWRTQP